MEVAAEDCRLEGLAAAAAEAKRLKELAKAPKKETKAEAKARKKAERKAKRAARLAAKNGTAVAPPPAPQDEGKEHDDSQGAAGVRRGDAGKLTEEQVRTAKVRAVTGVLDSAKEEVNLKFSSVSLMVGGNQLVTDCDLALSQGCRYGLIGTNGSGKSNVLAALAQRDLPVPEHIDM